MPPKRLDKVEAIAAERASSSLGRQYDRWGQFDDHGAIAQLENEGKSADEYNCAVRTGAGAASMTCTDYVKDAEEVGLDEELVQKRGALQSSMNERLADGADLKVTQTQTLTLAELDERAASRQRRPQGTRRLQP